MKAERDIKSEIGRMLAETYGVSKTALDIVERAEDTLKERFQALNAVREYNQYKVISAFKSCRLSDTHFGWNTGYGYNDSGREVTERIYARIFGTEAALVRPTIANGTHAIAAVFFGLLRPGDELLYCSGKPYDTMQTVTGYGEEKGSGKEGEGTLKDFGILYREVELDKDGRIDIEAVKKAISPKTKVAALQRSTGYSHRNAFGIEEIREWCNACRSAKPDIICMVDNCYGEFTQAEEPTEVGADIMAGSLIKNPGGGLALSGGYIAGREDLVEKAACRITSPGIGGDCGLTFGQTRSVLQGLFLAPSAVNSAVKGAILCGKVFESAGYKVFPKPEDARNDIIQAVILNDKELVRAFCEGIQEASPVDSHVCPIPADMPGYRDKVIMAAGTFVQGASIELTADAPMREPYTVYFQGGLTYEHSKLGVLIALDRILKRR